MANPRVNVSRRRIAAVALLAALTAGACQGQPSGPQTRLDGGHRLATAPRTVRS